MNSDAIQSSPALDSNSIKNEPRYEARQRMVDELYKSFTSNMDVLDLNEDGFVSRRELSAAQKNPSLTNEQSNLVNFLDTGYSTLSKVDSTARNVAQSFPAFVARMATTWGSTQESRGISRDDMKELTVEFSTDRATDAANWRALQASVPTGLTWAGFSVASAAINLSYWTAGSVALPAAALFGIGAAFEYSTVRESGLKTFGKTRAAIWDVLDAVDSTPQAAK